MSTPHNQANLGDIAKSVLMPGDPLRAKYIAEKYLTDVKLFNTVRNMFGYTGYYKGKKISIMGSGMGMPSIGIYSYELFSFYGVDNIIRIGSCGAYKDELNLFDVILTEGAYSDSSYAKLAYGYNEKINYPSKTLNSWLRDAAKDLGIKVYEGLVHSSDVFYTGPSFNFREFNKDKNCLVVEMEAFSLFANAKFLNKNAACLLTVSDSLVHKVETTAEERQKSFNQMVEIALEALAKNV